MKNYRRGFKLLDCISRITIYNISTYFCITTSTDRPQHDKYNSHSNNPTNWGTAQGLLIMREHLNQNRFISQDKITYVQNENTVHKGLMSD